MSGNLFDSYEPERRGGKTPTELSLFVHKELKASLLCSEHGENRYDSRGYLIDGIIVAWKEITWPDEKQREAFRSWQMRDEKSRAPIALTFAIPEWLAMKRGLI